MGVAGPSSVNGIDNLRPQLTWAVRALPGCVLVQGMTPDEIAAGYPQLTLAQVHAALAYYFDHREEIHGEVREDRDLAQEVKAKSGPGPLERKIKGSEAPRDSVSSR